MMDVAGATAAMLEARDDALAVVTMSPLGFWDDPHDDDFRLMGTMGTAAALGLGVSLGRPDRAVWVVDGDGSLAMQLGVVTAIADAAPVNLVHIVVANDVYAVSGAQPVPGPVDWAAMALGAGYRDAATCSDADELRTALGSATEGPRMVVARCARERPDYPEGAFAGIKPDEEARRVRGVLAG